MYIFPYQRAALYSPLSPQEVFHRLDGEVRPRRTFAERMTELFRQPAVDSSKSYEGDLQPDRFKISRIISYQNSFQPFITGRVTPEGPGSLVSLTLAMHPAVYLFGVIWFSMVLLVLAAGLLAFWDGSASTGDLGIPLAMFLFGFVLFNAGFWFETRRSLRFFKELLETL